MIEKSIKKSEEKLIDEIREKVDLIVLVSMYTPLQRRGNKHVAYRSCPFCGKANYFTADSDKQLYHCFNCGAGGDIFSFVMETRDMSFPEAKRYLVEEFNIDMKEEDDLDGITEDGIKQMKEYRDRDLFLLLYDFNVSGLERIARKIKYLLEFPQIKELYEKGEADYLGKEKEDNPF